MAIKDEYVETSWNRSTCTYYKSLGYKFTKNGDSLMIKAYELKPKSDVKITAICEECGEERKIARYNYRDICSKCNGKRCSKLAHKKIKELCENPEYRENKRKRLSEHCRRYMLTNEVKERVKVINRETFKRLWKDPEFAKRVKAGCKEYFKNKVNEGVFKNRTKKEKEEARLTIDIIIWRKSIYTRDNYTCQCCFKRGKGLYLNAHHLNGFNWCKEERYSLDNGVTLCRDCHNNFHKIYGKKHVIKEMYYEFIQNIKPNIFVPDCEFKNA